MERKWKQYRIVSWSVAILMAGVMQELSYAASDGVSGHSGVNGSTCADAGCHTPTSSAPALTISGPASVAAGSTHTYMVTISGGPGAVAGPGSGGGMMGPGGMMGGGGTTPAPGTGTPGGGMMGPGGMMGGGTTPTPTPAPVPGTGTTPGSGGMMGPGGMMGSGGGPRTGGTAGIDISASDGTLASTMINTKMLNGEVVHSAPAALTPMGVTYTFNWTAPASGTPTLNVTGLSTNNDATSSGDGTGSAVMSITVTSAGGNQAPVAQIAGPTTGTAGTPVTFNGAGSSDADGTIASYAWNFGDGTAGSGVSTTHTYTAGSYTVTLTVTDNAGATGTANSTINIASSGNQSSPVAHAGGPYTGNVNMAVSFDGSNSTDADGTITSYSWSFGDGTVGSGAQPTHIYSTAGTYPVNLTVTDNSGATGTATTSATINRNMNLSAAAGAQLYADHCASCHGTAGMGGPDKPVMGASAQAIATAIKEVPEMQSLQLTADQIAAIACYLKAVCPQPSASTTTPTGAAADTNRAAAVDSSPVSAGCLDWLTLMYAAWCLRMRLWVKARQIIKT